VAEVSLYELKGKPQAREQDPETGLWLWPVVIGTVPKSSPLPQRREKRSMYGQCLPTLLCATIS